MSATRTPGIRLGRDGRFFIDKRYRGIRIGMRVGPVTQEQAEQRLKREMQQVDVDLTRRAHWRPTFADCAQRYLAQSRDMRSLEAMRIHVELLVTHIGHLEPHQVHDATLAPLISEPHRRRSLRDHHQQDAGGRAHDPAPRGALIPR
jgi:hypothetical protein